MDDIYEATLLVSITFLSLVVPVFVFSVSLLGQAIERARKEREEAEDEKRRELGQEIEELKSALDKARKTGNTSGISQFSTRIKKLEKKKKNAIRKIERTSRALTVRGTVLLPGVFFMVAVGSCAGARALRTLTMFNSSVTWGFLLWIFAVGFLCVGLFFFWRTLNVIQLVAVPSEQAAYRRMVTAFKQAQKEIEEERLPKIEFHWKNKKPLVFSKGETRKIPFHISLVKGYSAEHVDIWFFACPEIEFPNVSTWKQPANTGEISGFTITIMHFEEIIMPGTGYVRSIEIRAPHKEGSFELFVQVECIGFSGTMQRFLIRVKADEEVPF